MSTSFNELCDEMMNCKNEVKKNLTPELTRPAPGETIKTNSPTQDGTHLKVRHLGSALSDLLAGPPGSKTPLN